jgi:hypothetical protein
VMAALGETVDSAITNPSLSIAIRPMTAMGPAPGISLAEHLLA